MAFGAIRASTLTDGPSVSSEAPSVGVGHLSGVAGAVKLFLPTPLREPTTGVIALDRSTQGTAAKGR